MIILKLVCIAVCGLIITILLKNCNSPFVPVSAIITGLAVIYTVFPYVYDLIQIVKNISATDTNLNIYLETIIKIIVIALIGEFSAQLCSDAGENFLASKIYFGTKIIMLYQISPLFIRFIKTIVIMVQEL